MHHSKILSDFQQGAGADAADGEQIVHGAKWATLDNELCGFLADAGKGHQFIVRGEIEIEDAAFGNFLGSACGVQFGGFSPCFLTNPGKFFPVGALPSAIASAGGEEFEVGESFAPFVSRAAAGFLADHAEGAGEALGDEPFGKVLAITRDDKAIDSGKSIVAPSVGKEGENGKRLGKDAGGFGSGGFSK
jgi:hypothetical protein